MEKAVENVKNPLELGKIPVSYTHLGTIPPENEKQYLRIIANESRRLSRLVRRMLDVSQLPVSYTHLDVYKRQAAERRPGK